MKNVELEVHRGFLKKSIRKKEDIVLLVLRIVELLLSEVIRGVANSENFRLNPSADKEVIYIVVKKMSRVFYCVENEKIHSFQFPFTIRLDDGVVMVYYRDLRITSELLSLITMIFSDLNMDKNVVSKVDDYMKQKENEDYAGIISTEKLNEIFAHLCLFEPGYIRYDYDESERSSKVNHPENHFDIFYESGNTAKLGIRKKVCLTDLISILDITDRCFYLEV